uniref:Putative O-antigen ligase n=1 Tax=viral metagenome TaxID=1070528 RepID=A0A6M3KZL6_9ZZZZ
MKWLVKSRNSFNERSCNLLIAFEIFKKFPLFGSGSGSFSSLKADVWRKLVQEGRIIGHTLQGEHVHCDPVEILMELGIVGFLCWSWMLGVNIANSQRFLPLFVVMFVCSLFYFPTRRPHTGLLFWTTLGMLSV